MLFSVRARKGRSNKDARDRMFYKDFLTYKKRFVSPLCRSALVAPAFNPFCLGMTRAPKTPETSSLTKVFFLRIPKNPWCIFWVIVSSWRLPFSPFCKEEHCLGWHLPLNPIHESSGAYQQQTKCDDHKPKPVGRYGWDDYPSNLHHQCQQNKNDCNTFQY